MTCRESPDAIRRQLEMAADHGLQAMVCDTRFAPSGESDWREQASAAVEEYRELPAVFGFFVRDEPACQDLEQVGAMVGLLRSEAPEKVAYVNAYGCGGRGADSYAEYVEQYARIIRPSFLSFDCYPISRPPSKADCDVSYADDCGVEWPEIGAYYRDCYWDAWETFRQVCWKYDLPLWGFALATPHAHSVWFYGPVTEGTVRLEVFTGLAHGIHALQYFTLYGRTSPSYSEGVLTADGQPSEQHPFFSQVNREVSVLGAIVRELRCTGVFHTGPLTSGCRRFTTPRPGRDTSHRPLAALSGDPCIVSFLRGEDGQRHIMFVNRNPAKAGRILAELEDGWQAGQLEASNGTECGLDGPRIRIDLEPGDGMLFRLHPPADDVP